MKIGKHSYIDGNINIIGKGQSNLTIGNFCSIAANVTIFLGDYHNTEWITTYPFGHMNKHIFNKFNGYGHPNTKGDVIIGNDVWIGRSSVIMSGVTIGDGAIIAANTIVTKNVKPYSILAGNPGVIKKIRFSDNDINFLLELKWWNMDDKIIDEISPILCSGNIELLKDIFQSK